LATEKQIAANRANAKRSTGPKTAAGKQKSSCNAYRHGLSRPELSDPIDTTKVNAIAVELAGAQATEDRLKLARDFASAQIELARVQAIRAEQWEKINPNEGLDHSPKNLNRLAALDRYERYAFTKRRRASRELRSLT
jgi:hypothetical protein